MSYRYTTQLLSQHCWHLTSVRRTRGLCEVLLALLVIPSLIPREPRPGPGLLHTHPVHAIGLQSVALVVVQVSNNQFTALVVSSATNLIVTASMYDSVMAGGWVQVSTEIIVGHDYKPWGPQNESMMCQASARWCVCICPSSCT